MIQSKLESLIGNIHYKSKMIMQVVLEQTVSLRIFIKPYLEDLFYIFIIQSYVIMVPLKQAHITIVQMKNIGFLKY